MVLGNLALCVCFFISSVLSLVVFAGSNLLVIWVFLEMSTLCLVPVFFMSLAREWSVKALFSFFVVSCVSSGLIMCGFIKDSLVILVYIGLILKFGIFPFFCWVYHVLVNSNWFVALGLSTFLKCPIFLFPILYGLGVWFVGLDGLIAFTLFVLSLAFWLYSYNWYCCWTHMMLASTAVLVMAVLGLPLSISLTLFLVYVCWTFLVVLLFFKFKCNSGYLSLGWWFSYFILLIASPLSIVLFYKLISVYCVLSCPWLVVFSWVVYSISEQLFLFSWAVNNSFPRDVSGFGDYL